MDLFAKPRRVAGRIERFGKTFDVTKRKAAPCVIIQLWLGNELMATRHLTPPVDATAVFTRMLSHFRDEAHLDQALAALRRVTRP